jgi:hypothetical protein
VKSYRDTTPKPWLLWLKGAIMIGPALGLVFLAALLMHRVNTQNVEYCLRLNVSKEYNQNAVAWCHKHGFKTH